MADFKIGDKVRIAFDEDVDKTGVIVDTGVLSHIIGQYVNTRGEPKKDMDIPLWIVKLDDSGEEKEYLADKLEKVLPSDII